MEDSDSQGKNLLASLSTCSAEATPIGHPASAKGVKLPTKSRKSSENAKNKRFGWFWMYVAKREIPQKQPQPFRIFAVFHLYPHLRLWVVHLHPPPLKPAIETKYPGYVYSPG